MNQGVAPLTPVDCDLTDFAFMPLDVARLRDSEMASNETPEACWAAVQLWSASWHQVPAGSVPNDDKWLAKATGYGRIVKEWLRVRPGALRGFLECTDGRLYHVVVSEKAREAWQAKIEQRYRTEVARVKKHNQRHGTSFTTPEFSVWLSLGRPSGHHLAVPGDKTPKDQDTGGDSASKRQGEGQGQGQGQGDSYSVPDGTADEAGKSPLDMTKVELWTTGKSLLAEQGMPAKQCGSFVGKLVKDYGDEIVIEAVRAACVARPVDAAEYLKALCLRASGQRISAEPTWRTEQRERTQQAAPGVAVGGQHADQFFIEAEARHVIAHNLG